jgi:hypothetical protein
MLELPSVVLACIDCVDPNLAIEALEISRRNLRFARVALLSNRAPATLPAGIDLHLLPQRLDLTGYNLFTLRELWHRIAEGEHVLTIQTDGFVLHPERWEAEFLRYDYVGAPWKRGAPHAKHTRVGNSGFCLRSRRLLQATAELFTDRAESGAQKRWKRVFDDLVTCNDLYQSLTARGLTFAPPAVAARFAHETPTDLRSRLDTAFGFHGRGHAPAILLKERFGGARPPAAAVRPEVVLVVSYFRPADAWRRFEIDRALKQNCDCEPITRVVAVCDPGCYPELQHAKLRVVDAPADRRPTFAELVAIADEACGAHDVRVVANADIGFDLSAALFRDLGQNEFWAVTRHEESPDGPDLWNVPYSQDVWAWRGPCRATKIDFEPGRVACDNVIAARAKAAGYVMRNPACSLVAIHYHRDPQRSA